MMPNPLGQGMGDGAGINQASPGPVPRKTGPALAQLRCWTGALAQGLVQGWGWAWAWAQPGPRDLAGART